MKRIESPQNSLVKHWKKLVLTRKERDKSQEFVVEGFHLVEEALKTKGTVLSLIVRDGTDLPLDWDLEGVHIVEVPNQVAKEISETEHPQGVFAHCRQPSYEAQDAWKKLLLIDAVQDPGNIGTMIRTADAAGIDAVILGKGSADPYNPKTVRAAQGSHFHIPILKGDLQEWTDRLKASGIPIFGTAIEGGKHFASIESRNAFALLMGNEGAGISESILQKTDQNVTIPILGKAESLNVAVATGILLYTLVGEG